MDDKLLSLINLERSKVGSNPLNYRLDIQQASDLRAQEASVKWSHDRPNGKPYYSVNDAIYGENLAYGFNSAEEIVKAWLDSPTHRKVMLDNKYNGASIGVYDDGKNKWYSLELTI